MNRMSEWKSRKINNLQRFLDESRREMKKYKNTGRIIYLAQASNKLYNAYVFMLEAFLREELKYTKQISKATFAASKKDMRFDILYRYVRDLHQFFYEMTADPKYTQFTIRRKVLPLFTRLRKKYNLYR